MLSLWPALRSVSVQAWPSGPYTKTSCALVGVWASCGLRVHPLSASFPGSSWVCLRGCCSTAWLDPPDRVDGGVRAPLLTPGYAWSRTPMPPLLLELRMAGRLSRCLLPAGGAVLVEDPADHAAVWATGGDAIPPPVELASLTVGALRPRPGLRVPPFLGPFGEGRGSPQGIRNPVAAASVTVLSAPPEPGGPASGAVSVESPRYPQCRSYTPSGGLHRR